MKFRLHAFEPTSRANGPGLRAVVWFQGCTLACPGCFNPATHDPQRGYESDTATLAMEILALGTKIEAVSISGGEPFQQPEALLDLLERVSAFHFGHLVFTGYTLSELNRLPLGTSILRHIDVLIAGRYAAAQPVGQGLLGSVNQEIHLLTNRYTLPQILCVPRRELILRPDGTIITTGLSPWALRT
jgi:anaerobic ribonucleoside-triphosphate reductase activating protein